MTPEELKQQLEYYRDLGINHIYRQDAAPVQEEAVSSRRPEPARAEPVREEAKRTAPVDIQMTDLQLPWMAPASDSLERIREDIGECRRCRLHEGRNKLV